MNWIFFFSFLYFRLICLGIQLDLIWVFWVICLLVRCDDLGTNIQALKFISAKMGFPPKSSKIK